MTSIGEAMVLERAAATPPIENYIANC